MGELQHKPFQFAFNGFLKVAFQGSRVTSDAGLILVRELDERRCFRNQLLLLNTYLVLTKPLSHDIQCQRCVSVKIGCKYLDNWSLSSLRQHWMTEAPESGELVREVPDRATARSPFIPEGPIDIIERAHPDLGRLGVFWHTQGSGKSYSMAFFAEKVRRKLEGNFTFLLMTDRNDLDRQIYKTFIGCGIADDQTPRAASGDDLEKLLKENHRYVFSLIHKFNKDVDPKQPYSERDDIIVISDEAHRTQAGRLARNMRLALPTAAFIGFTGTPLFGQDELTKRIFGDYVSRYDFKRSEEDGATVKLVYENRGEKLGVARMDLNDRIAAKIDEAELNPDQEALLDKLLGQDYEVITADERLDKIAADFVEHCATRWESGKSMLICIDKITCARMLQLIAPRWQAKAASVRAAANAKGAAAQVAGDKITGSVARFGITRENPLGGPRYAANPNTLWISCVCPTTSPFAIHRACPLRSACMISMPRKVRHAVVNRLKPSIGRVRRLMNRWSCSMMLFRYLHWRRFERGRTSPSCRTASNATG